MILHANGSSVISSLTLPPEIFGFGFELVDFGAVPRKLYDEKFHLLYKGHLFYCTGTVHFGYLNTGYGTEQINLEKQEEHEDLCTVGGRLFMQQVPVGFFI
jgi:hypothetical protein